MESMKNGRPLTYATPEALQGAIDKYFHACDNRTKEVLENGIISTIEAPAVYTVEGLALALGMDRRSLINYDKDARFFPIIKKAKIRCLAKHTEKALDGDVNTTFSIFLYKNNYGYRDRVEHKVDVTTVSEEVRDLEGKLTEDEIRQYKELNDKIGIPFEGKQPVDE